MPDNVIDSFLVAIGWKTDRASAQAAGDALNRTRSQATATQKEIGQLGQRMKALGEEFTKFAGTPTDKTITSAERIRRTHLRLSGEIKSLGLTAAATTTTFVAGFSEIARKYSDLYYVAQRTGTAAANLSSLRFGGEQIGVGADQMTAIVNNMAAAIRMSPGLGGVLRSLGGDFSSLATGTGAARDRTREFLGFVDQMAKQAPYYRDRLGQMFGIPPDVMEQLVLNRATLRKTFDDYSATLRKAGIDEDAFYKRSAQISRDWASLWGHAELILQQSFQEAFPAVHKALSGIDSLITNHVLPANARHPGAATAETAAASYATGMTGLALLGKVPGLGVAGKGAGALARLGPYGALLTLGADTDPEATRYTMHHQASGPGFLGEGGTLEKWITRHLSRGAAAGGSALAGLPAFQHGGIVAKVHPGEMVLPKEISDGLQAMISGGGHSRAADYLTEWLRGSSGYRPFVQIDPQSLRDFFSGNASGGAGYHPGGRFGGLAPSRMLPSPAGMAGHGKSGPQAGTIASVARAAGASDAAITAMLAGAMGEGGLSSTWRPGDHGTSFGPWQLHKGGELNRYLAEGNKPGDVAAQTRYVLKRLNEIHPGFSRMTDPLAATSVITRFERGVQGLPYYAANIGAAQRALSGTSGAASPSGGVTAILARYTPQELAAAKSRGMLMANGVPALPPGFLVNSHGEPYSSSLLHMTPQERANEHAASAAWAAATKAHNTRFFSVPALGTSSAAGGHSISASQTNNFHFGAGGAVPAAIHRALSGAHDRLAATIVRNTRAVLN